MDLFEITPDISVLAIFAHPDDAETGAGGTLARYAKNNCKVEVLHVASGDKGVGQTSDRELESNKAKEILGIGNYYSLGYFDGEFENDLELRRQLAEKIRELKPNVIICPDPTAVFFSHLYLNHRDHRTTGWAVIDVVAGATGNPKYFPQSDAHSVGHLLCAGSLAPNCAVDITETIDEKIDSVLCYESQIGENSTPTKQAIENTAKSTGDIVRLEYAEAFRYCALQSSSSQFQH